MSENSSIVCLRALSGVYIEAEIAGDSIGLEQFKRDAFILTKMLLKEGGVPVLPSREEFTLYDTGGLFKIRFSIMPQPGNTSPPRFTPRYNSLF